VGKVRYELATLLGRKIGIQAHQSSNFLGTQFAIYDNGRNPLRHGTAKDNTPIRKEYGVVLYVSKEKNKKD
jgi:hypothetical protein